MLNIKRAILVGLIMIAAIAVPVGGSEVVSADSSNLPCGTC